jgi:hypothetical protein
MFVHFGNDQHVYFVPYIYALKQLSYVYNVRRNFSQTNCNSCSSSLRFYRWSVVVAVLLLVVVGPADRPDVYVELNMSRAFSRPSSRAQQLQ